MLTDAARLDERQAVFQLAHEVIHLLAPTGAKDAMLFEEGLATAFSHEMSPRYGGYSISVQPSYLAAEAAARQFLTLDQDGVRKIRAEEPSFSKFTPNMISRICPKIPIELGQYFV